MMLGAIIYIEGNRDLGRIHFFFVEKGIFYVTLKQTWDAVTKSVKFSVGNKTSTLSLFMLSTKMNELK